MKAPILYDSHMHTALCKHAQGTPVDYAAVAEKRGLKGIIITCHNPGPNDAWSSRVRMKMAQFDDYVAMVEQARQTWLGRVEVQLGLECDYIPGMESWLEQLQSRANFHHLLGSVHPSLPYYRNRYFLNGVLEYQKTYFDHLAMAAESGLFDTLSHPDLVKNVFPYQWNLDALLDDIKRSLDRIAKTGVAMELNTSGIFKEIKEMNPGPRLLMEMKQRDIPVVLGSDAHTPSRVGAGFETALNMLQEVGFTHVHHYLGRRRQAVGLENAKKSLQVVNSSNTV